MSNEHTNPSDRDQRLNDLIAAYVEAVEAGQAPDRQHLLDQHPDLANELQAFFADYERMDHLASPLRPMLS